LERSWNQTLTYDDFQSTTKWWEKKKIEVSWKVYAIWERFVKQVMDRGCKHYCTFVVELVVNQVRKKTSFEVGYRLNLQNLLCLFMLCFKG